MADKNLVKHIINKNNMFHWTYNNVTHYSNSTVFWKSYLIFFFGYLWKKPNKNKAVLRDYIVLVLLCHACVIWIQIIMITSFYLKTVLLFSHLPSCNKNIFETLNVKDFVCKSYACAETSILARLGGMMQLNGEKSSWKNGIPHL